jgi:hypothetical protein
MPLKIALAIAIDIELTGDDAPADRALPDRGTNDPSSPLDICR